MEAAIDINECSEDQMVKYATHSLAGEALCWWDNIKLALGRRVTAKLTLGEFKALMEEQYCPNNDCGFLEKEFVNLEAGSTTHLQYTTKFNQMARVLHEMVKPLGRLIGISRDFQMRFVGWY
jgi:hypothetical protein